MLAAGEAAADHGTHVTLEPDTRGCNGVLPSRDGNTDMRLVGGTLVPGGTAVFEISYPVNSSSVGKEFTITDCAFINGVAALRYTVEFVPSNTAYVLVMALAVPIDAPVGGEYCNYAKTTGSPTAAQGSQRKAGPACFIILGPTPPAAAPAPAVAPAPAPAGAATATGTAAPRSTPAAGRTATSQPAQPQRALPNTATRPDAGITLAAGAALLGLAGVLLLRRSSGASLQPSAQMIASSRPTRSNASRHTSSS